MNNYAVSILIVGQSTPFTISDISAPDAVTAIRLACTNGLAFDGENYWEIGPGTRYTVTTS